MGINDLMSIIITCCMERYMFLFCSSLLGFIDAAKINIDNDPMQVANGNFCFSTSFVLSDIYCVLRFMPAFVFHPANVDILRVYLDVAKLFKCKGMNVPTDLVSTIKRLSSRTPVFVINLHEGWIVGTRCWSCVIYTI